MLIDKIKNYKLLQKLQKKFAANVAYQGIGTYQDVLDDQGYIKSTKSLPKHAGGKLPGYEDGKEPEPVQAAKSAINFANLYYNSPGFNERFRNVTSDKIGFLNS
jgi:hypothetical protein